MKSKVWVTQYALSRGIEEFDAADLVDNGNAVVPGKYAGYTRFIRAVHIHFSLDDAERRFWEMRAAKIKNLRNQLSRLDQLEIKVVQR